LAGTHLVTFPMVEIPCLSHVRGLPVAAAKASLGLVRSGPPTRRLRPRRIGGLHVIPFLADRFIGHAKSLAAGTSLARNVVPRRWPG